MARGWTRILPQLAAAVFFFAAAESAGAADWSLAQMSGKVAISVQGAQPVSLSKGEVLPSGGILTTGPASRALLVRSEETMVVGANAAIAIPPGSNNRQFTTVLEKAGLVEFTVERQNVQHFAVETPYLAAVVKGTQFTVEVTPAGGAVRVTRGVVEVTALATGYVTNLTAGQSAVVKADGTLALGGVGPRPTVYQGTPRAPVVDQQFASLQSPGGSNGGGFFARLFGGSGGAGIQAGLGDNGVNAGVSLRGASIDASVGSGASVGASLGSVDADVNVGGGGISASAAVGGVSAGASVGGGGVQVDTSVASVSASGGGGVQVDAGPVSVGVGGGGGIDVDVGGIHIGLGGR